jgi:excisionase family DNA binding protein
VTVTSSGESPPNDNKTRLIMKQAALATRKRQRKKRRRNVDPVTKLVYSIPEACEAAGVNKDTIYKGINKGQLRSLKIGRRRLIRFEALSKWLEDLEDDAA